MDKFKVVMNLLQKRQTTIGFGAIPLLTAGAEHAFSNFAFRCPCSEWNFLYGTVSLLVPATALLILGYMLSNKTWKLFTGLCLKKSKLFRFKYLCGCFTVFTQITMTAMVAPVSWIAIALLNGVYFECIVTGTNITQLKSFLCSDKSDSCKTELYRLPCKTSIPSADREAVLTTIRAQSQILGWLVIASIMLFSLLFTCMARCNSPVSYLQLKFWKTYSQKENNFFDKYATEHAEKLAERNIKSFFELSTPAPQPTPPKIAWEKVSSFYKFRTMDKYYSTVHKYVETCRNPENPMRVLSTKSGEGDLVNPAALAFLDEGMML
ncbi:calcium homeostasis modulator protein 6 [Alosa sapidissima]|uniref:calcium homeostasis modulator protein 6 n=1 Tax=Alosa sapidissima TaxID=34773 RepID=UPI001C08B4C5|nr:calcium homeostasis modulator protein 6 [Alosa sapidissima]